MAFTFTNQWPGGALGKLGNAIVALQKALENFEAGHKILIQKRSDNSLKISYVGPVARNGWNGKIYKSGTSSPIVNIDVKDPDNIKGEYICVNPDTGDYEWSNEPRTDAGWSSFRVAEPWNDPNGDLPESFGQYALTADFNGSIVVGGGDVKILTGDPDPGFVFEEVEEGEDAGALQMKVKGTASAGRVLVADGNGGASWEKPTVEVTAEGTTLTVALSLGLNYYSGSVSGVDCPTVEE